MAITRAQQARQLYRFGGDTMGGPNDRSRGGLGPAGSGAPEDRGSAEQNRNQRAQVREGRIRAAENFIDRDLLGFTDAAKFNIAPGIVRLLQNLPQGGRPVDANRFPGGGGDSQAMATIPTWMQLGFNSEAEYLASLEQETEDPQGLEGLRLAFRAEGGPIGGEYDFESARQMYGLGKLVKKVTKTVKKIAKSPIGKAALIGAAGFGIPGTSLGGIFGRASFGGFAPGVFGFGGIGNAAIAAKAKLFGSALPPSQGLGKTKGLLDFVGGKAGAGIIGTSIAAGLLTPEQEKQAQELAAEEGIDIDAARNSILARARGNIKEDYRALSARAEGGRIGLKEGEGIMKMASAPDPMDSLNDMAQMLFGKNLDQLTDEEYIELLDAARDGMSEGGRIGLKEGEGIMKIASAPDLADSINEMKEMLARDFFGKPLGDLSDDELIQIDEMLDNMSKIKEDSPSVKLAEGGKPEPVAKKTMPLLDMGGKEMDLRDNGGFVPIGRMEKADDVPARLSKNEFVFTADAVRNAGDGDVDKGAEVMYNMMKNLEAGGEVSEESQGLEGARKMFQTSQRLEEVL